ncbi:MAG: TlpA family protein disulfide reductase [Gammaproteobacteria bacterium]|nr:TlpA family protein disulfide reductase [Gammaproteobacteria bacterium]
MKNLARALASALFILGAAIASASDLRIHQYHGKILLIDFWASWCSPCRQEFAWLNEMQDELGPRGLVIVGVNVDEDRKLAEAFLLDRPAHFEIIYDSPGKIANSFGVAGMPTAVILDRDGDKRFQRIGFTSRDKDRYEKQLKALVAERDKAPM